MLTLQRASAGSGKTFTLTKRYIALLISTVDPGKTTPRLRTVPELADSMPHILAVTFTNKATNEMKERIVAKLHDLAFPPADGRKPDYMADFVKEFSTTETRISAACREALHQLLYEYSDFNISTIDAFFQNILRTFAYESDLPDSYQVVIDDSYLSRHAALGLVDAIAHGEADAEEKFWVRELVERASSGGRSTWNLFQLREGSRNNRSVFGELAEMAASVEKTELAGVRKALDDYEAGDITLREAMTSTDAMIEEKSAGLFARLVAAARDVLEQYSAYGDPAALVPNGSNTMKFIAKVLDADADPMGDFRLTLKSDAYIGSKVPKGKAAAMLPLKEVWEEFSSALGEWKEWLDGEEVRSWTAMIRPALPGVALMTTLRRRINDYLTDNDAMRIADTNTMIRRIIADDDVPFIYERLGNRLNHFLIDEFQDTSLLQWENFRPLLEESESHGYANLIIGDAKQSIYRFRSAEPTLITDIVPARFPQLEARGFSQSDNSNWRSRANVVRFNNFFFRALSHRLGAKIASLYSNTVQLPRSKESEEGYVEIDFYDREAVAADIDTADDGGDDRAKIPAPIVERVGRLITSLLRRGYRQKEIAVIVNTRKAGREVIDGLMNYNLTLNPETDETLEFVSEDSLTLDASGAVATVIECFRLIQENVEGAAHDPVAQRGKADTAMKGVNWADVQNSYRFYAARHSDLDIPSLLSGFFKEGIDSDLLDTLISGMQAITLPSLTETLIEAFVTPAQRRREAPFLAAFQDAVLDYCEVNPTDVGSMLRWWDGGGKNTSISSPDDTDAINVMTIHKSKGLEFECVILPDIDLRLDIKSETLWVPVPKRFGYADRLPAMLPLSFGSEKSVEELGVPEWSRIYGDERYGVQVDQINKAYVAFTRAASELYVFLQAPIVSDRKEKEEKEGSNAKTKKKKAEPALFDLPEDLPGMPLGKHLDTSDNSAKRMRGHAFDICRKADDILHEIALAAEPPAEGELPEEALMPGQGEVVASDGIWQFTYGAPVARVPETLARRRENKDHETEQRHITHYFVNSNREVLKSHPEGTRYVQDVADDDRIDPRSEGSLKHAALELVESEDDLHMALARLRGRGMITRKKMRQYEEELSEALESVRDRGWFDGTWRVLNERPLLKRGEIMRRPDRVMESADGDAIVIDYKFGDATHLADHRRQVGEYMNLLKELGRYRSVRGYIWYVRYKEIVEVEAPEPHIR